MEHLFRYADSFGEHIWAYKILGSLNFMVGCLLSTWDTGKGHTPMLCIASSFPSPAWHGQSLGPPFQLHQVYQHMITNSQCDRESPVLEGHDVTSWERNHHETKTNSRFATLTVVFHRWYLPNSCPIWLVVSAQFAKSKNASHIGSFPQASG